MYKNNDKSINFLKNISVFKVKEKVRSLNFVFIFAVNNSFILKLPRMFYFKRR